MTDDNKSTALVVDDDPTVIGLLAYILESASLRVLSARSGYEALEILKSANPLPDIILLDLNMPRMSGIEFLKILKADEVMRYLPTIILTTSENRVDLLECYKTGIAGYIIKPLIYQDYQDKLEKVFAYWDVNELVKG